MPKAADKKTTSKQGNWWWRRFLISFVPFIIFSLGFFPVLLILVFLYFFVPLQVWTWIILSPFLLIILMMLTFVSQLLFSGSIIRIFHIIYEEGTYEYTLRDTNVFKWMLICQLYTPMRKLMEIIPMGEIRNIYLRLLGMKIGENTLVGGVIKDPCMTSFGSNTTMGEYAVLYGHIHDKAARTLTITRIDVGDNCVIGAGAIVMPGARMENNVLLGAGSLVPQNKTLEKNSIYVGSPAQKRQKGKR